MGSLDLLIKFAFHSSPFSRDLKPSCYAGLCSMAAAYPNIASGMPACARLCHTCRWQTEPFGLFVPTLDVTLHANNRELKTTRLQRAPAPGDNAWLFFFFFAGLQHQQVHESSGQSHTRLLKPAAAVIEQQECPMSTCLTLTLTLIHLEEN